MGVPKLKWTSEEEAALKAGIAKHGLGKWSAILKDAEFNSVLRMRSNVDLKDKWRNMNCMVYGSRQRSRPAKSQPVHNHENTSQEENNMQICIVNPVPESSPQPLQIHDPKNPISMPRLDSLILEMISNMKDPHGCTRAEIAEYIEENHSSTPNLHRQLKQELKNLIESGKVIKIKHRYRIKTASVSKKKRSTPLVIKAKEEGGGHVSGTKKAVTKEEIDAELEKMTRMTPQQAAEVALKAVAEAEAAIVEAERAEREAKVAEADADLARGFAATAMHTLTAFWTR